MAERSLELACERASDRVAFGKPLAAQGVVQQQIAWSRVEIDQARLLTLHTASRIDEVGAKNARKEIAAIKVAAPLMAQTVIDRCMQIHGAGGLSSDFPMAHMFMWARAIRTPPAAPRTADVATARAARPPCAPRGRQVVPLPYETTRCAGLADGPDEVHLAALGKSEIREAVARREARKA